MKIHESVLKYEEKAVYGLRSLYRRYGYLPYKMSKFEEYDLYVRNKDFLVSDHIITFTDTYGKLLALKPDVTLSIIKNGKDTCGVQKLCYNEKYLSSTLYSLLVDPQHPVEAQSTKGKALQSLNSVEK